MKAETVLTKQKNRFINKLVKHKPMQRMNAMEKKYKSMPKGGR